MINYNYSLKRSARRSVSVVVKDDNSLIVHAPLKMPLNEIERFLLSKSRWIDGHLRKNDFANGQLADIISYKKIFVSGKAVDLSFGGGNSISADGVHIKSLKCLKKLYVENFGEQFLRLFNEISREFGFTFGSVDFKDYKAKWGCCDRNKNITFNYKLLMLPENLWRYVASHELCHTIYMDHSKGFHALLESVLPSCKTDRKQLKNYSRLTRLY